ncbi:MAG: nucleoside triphosphate pyrophosphohydrolase, partial [Peptostreptococcaceae bacterium]|nr:nucleoside triphosphate pyrophosphohydrolase [Peptostreptococcaceae bacterium]
FKLVDAFEIENSYIDVNTSMIITQIYDRFIASNVKLALMDYYDDEQEVCIVKAAGVKNLESKKYVKLYELDRPDNDFDYLTSLYIPKSEKPMYNTVKDLENIVGELRGEGGCDWDRKQTHESLKTHIVEEAYELVQAIENDDIDEMIEELGDLLLHVVFHSQIGKEDGYFDLREVVNGICNKLVYRHPHVFSNVEVDMNTYAKTWEDLKKKEKGETTVTEGLKRIPNSLPALTKANKVQYKAALVGFDWDNIEDVFKKIVEEYKELLDEHKQGNIKYIKEELGDLLFSIVNLARFLDINPEEALNLTTEKFINRFEYIENSAISNHKNLEDMTLEEMDNLWNEAKISKK